MDNNQGSSTDKDDANPIIADLKRQLEAAKKSENEAVQRASKRYKQAHEDRRRAEIAEKEIKLLKQEINGLHQRYATLEHTGREEFAQMKSELQKAREEQALAKPNLERISQERKEYLQAYHNTMKEVNRLHQEMQQAKAVAAHGQQAMKELGAARNIADAAKKTAESAQNQCRELHRLLQESKKVNGDLQKQCVFYQGQLQQRGEEEARKKVPLTASSVALDPGSPLHPSKKRKGNDGYVFPNVSWDIC
jgi:chromosome segregation ATPase